MIADFAQYGDKPPRSVHSERSSALRSAEDGTRSGNLLFRRRKTRFLDSAGSSAFADDPAALEMTMRNSHSEYVGARVLARARVNEKW